MAYPPFPPRWHEVVRAHHASTTGYVAAQRGNCLRIRDEEKRLVYGRSFKPIQTNALPRPHALTASWFLGVLLCPGDDTDAVAAWAAGLRPLDLNRIHFYHTPTVDVDSALAGWRAAGLREPRTYEVRNFSTFHHLFGRHHGDRVFQDFSGSSFE